MKPIELLVADQRALVRELLCCQLQREADLVISAEATSVDEAASLTRVRRPTVVIANAHLAGGGGARACKRIRESRPDTPVLIVSPNEADAYLASAWSAGASGFLTDEASLHRLTSTIRTIATGKRLFNEDQTRRIRLWHNEVEAPLLEITPREHQVLALLVSGLRNGDIAVELAISTKTVESHMTHLFSKLHVSSRREAIAWLRQVGALTTTLQVPVVKETQGVSPMRCHTRSSSIGPT